MFDFPPDIQTKIGYHRQETTMFHFEYIGDIRCLKPIDHEIIKIQLMDKDEVLEILSHAETRKFFIQYFC